MTPSVLLERLARHYDVAVDQILGRRRTADIAAARLMAYYLLWKNTHLSKKGIGRLLGGRDHSTVLRGIQEVLRNRGDEATELDAALCAGPVPRTCPTCFGAGKVVA